MILIGYEMYFKQFWKKMISLGFDHSKKFRGKSIVSSANVKEF